MQWSKVFDYFAYMGVLGLVIAGVADYFKPELFEDNPMFFFILALFLLMFIFTVKRSRRFYDDRTEDNVPKH